MAYYICLQCFFFFFFFIFTFTYSHAQMVPAMFVFGDSIADVGNNNYLKLSLAKADFPHNGIDFPTKKATGRFSNGKNSADFLAEKLAIPTSPPYLSLKSDSNKSNAFLGGVSFASGGAGILDGTVKLFRQSISLTQQVTYYSAVYDALVQQLGVTGTQQYLIKTIFAIVIGSNDILGYFDAESTPNYNPQQFLDKMILTLRAQLKRIYDLGARKFVVVGTGVVGCCPSQRRQNKTGECNEEANHWSLKYNEGVKSLLLGLKSELRDINYSFLETYSIMLDFIQKPAEYGFTEVKAACCGLGNFNAKIPCLPIAKYCENRRDHVFWDLYHPSEASASIFVDTLFDGSGQYVFPVNVRQLVAM